MSTLIQQHTDFASPVLQWPLNWFSPTFLPLHNWFPHSSLSSLLKMSIRSCHCLAYSPSLTLPCIQSTPASYKDLYFFILASLAALFSFLSSPLAIYLVLEHIHFCLGAFDLAVPSCRKTLSTTPHIWLLIPWFSIKRYLLRKVFPRHFTTSTCPRCSLSHHPDYFFIKFSIILFIAGISPLECKFKVGIHFRCFTHH